MPAACLDTLELLQKIDVKIGAPELAVGDALEAEIFLQAHDVADRRVLDCAQFLTRQLAFASRSRASSSFTGRRKLPT